MATGLRVIRLDTTRDSLTVSDVPFPSTPPISPSNSPKWAPSSPLSIRTDTAPRPTRLRRLSLSFTWNRPVESLEVLAPEHRKLVLVITTSDASVPRISPFHAAKMFPLPEGYDEVVVMFRQRDEVDEKDCYLPSTPPSPSPSARPLLPLLLSALVPILHHTPVTFVDAGFMVPFPPTCTTRHDDIWEPLQEALYRAVEATFNDKDATARGDGYEAAHRWDMVRMEEYRRNVGEKQWRLETS